MRFRVQVATGFEVRWRKVAVAANGRIAETTPSDGWLIDMKRFEGLVDAGLRSLSFGRSIETFLLGFEIADIETWGNSFSSTTEYISYRPKMKRIVSVAQLNYPDVKDLGAGEQFHRLAEAVNRSILRVSTMKRKPRDFDYEEMATQVARLLKHSSPKEVVALDSGS